MNNNFEEIDTYFNNIEEAERIKKIEDERKSPPTKELLNETKEMFKDFEIKIDIPKFGTAYELLMWRRCVIKETV